MKILAVLRHLEYKPWYALAEYVDNSIESYLTNRKRLPSNTKLRVSIEIDHHDKIIVVRDNAAGISEAEIPRAFRPAEPPNDASGLSQFGMGMKSASCWFSPIWEVRSTAIGEDVERRIRFDIAQIIENRLEELEIETTPAEPGAHFTEIKLRQIFHIPQRRTLGKIRDHLSDIYRCFLRDATVELHVAGTALEFTEPNLLQAPRFSADNEPEGDPVEWRKSIAFELADGRIVCGTAGLLARGDTKRAGLCLLRHNRAIVGTGEDKFRPHEVFGSGNSYESQRVWGELHMDEFDVSHTKDGFRWGDAEEEFLEKLRDSLDEDPLPLLKQARNYRSGRPSRSTVLTATTAAIDGVAGALTQHAASDLDNAESRTTPEPPPPISLDPTQEPPIEQRTFDIVAAGGLWTVTIELAADEGASQWLEIACDQSEAQHTRQVTLRVFLSSPFMRRVVRVDERDSLEPVLRIAAAIGLAEVLTRLSGAASGPGEVRRNINDLLGSSLSHLKEE